MDITEKILAHLRKAEGCNLDVRERILHDGRVEVFVGYGHNVVPADYLKKGDIIPIELAEEYLVHDFFWVHSKVKQIIPGFESYPEIIQIACADLAYNNGIYGFQGYKDFIIAIKAKDYPKAADEIIDSLNYRNPMLHKRYANLEQMVRSA